MLAASLLDRAESMTAREVHSLLIKKGAVEVSQDLSGSHPEKSDRHNDMLRTYIRYKAVIEIKLGGMRFFPSFQLRNGKIIDALGNINHEFILSREGRNPIRVSKDLLDWWQTPHLNLPLTSDRKIQSPLDLLSSTTEQEFTNIIHNTHTMDSLMKRCKGKRRFTC